MGIMGRATSPCLRELKVYWRRKLCDCKLVDKSTRLLVSEMRKLFWAEGKAKQCAHHKIIISIILYYTENQ